MVVGVVVPEKTKEPSSYARREQTVLMLATALEHGAAIYVR